MLKRDQLLERLSILTIFLVTISYAPRFWDPTVFPKVAVATIMGALMLVLSWTFTAKNPFKERNFFLTLLFALLALGLTSTLLSDDLYTGFFGISPRSNGFFGFHIALSFILIGGAIRRREFLAKLFWLISLTSLGQSLLGLAQDQGLQLIAAKNLYSPILGTFGNPNFLSAFLGFGLISSLFLLVEIKKPQLRFLLIVIIALNLFVILKSQSIQGLFMFMVGIVILASRLAWVRGIKAFISWVVVFILAIPLVIFGLLGRGPLGALLYQDSTFYRFDYWRIALFTIQDKPLFGVGPDQFAYSYITYRDADSMSRETNIVVDSAHNMFLQIGATFGLPYLLVLIALIGWLSVLAFRKILFTSSSITFSQLGLLALWAGFLTQTSISVDTISALVPGFFFGGLLLGQICTPLDKSDAVNKRSKKIVVNQPIPPLSFFLAFAISLLILYPPFNMFKVTSQIRDEFSSPGTTLSLPAINDRLSPSLVVGNGDRYLWSRIANFRYGSGDVETARAILDQSRRAFPNYPTFIDFQAQLAVTENRPLDALALRKEIYVIDKMNILNIKEILLLSRQLADRSTFDAFYALGTKINANFFSDIETGW